MSTADSSRARMQLGQLGIWTYQLSYQPAAKVREVVAELEELGYGTLWIGEGVYREPLTHAGFLLASSRRMVIADPHGLPLQQWREIASLARRESQPPDP